MRMMSIISHGLYRTNWEKPEGKTNGRYALLKRSSMSVRDWAESDAKCCLGWNTEPFSAIFRRRRCEISSKGKIQREERVFADEKKRRLSSEISARTWGFALQYFAWRRYMTGLSLEDKPVQCEERRSKKSVVAWEMRWCLPILKFFYLKAHPVVKLMKFVGLLEFMEGGRPLLPRRNV